MERCWITLPFGFTEPYLFDKPIQAGFTVFYQRYSYNQGQQASILAGQNLIRYYNSSGPRQTNLLNYVSNGEGFTTFVSYQLAPQLCARRPQLFVQRSNLNAAHHARRQSYFDYLDFEGVGGPNTAAEPASRPAPSRPTFAYNTVNHPIIPTHGLRINLSFGFTGSVLGGNVNTLQPSLRCGLFPPRFLQEQCDGLPRQCPLHRGLWR